MVPVACQNNMLRTGLTAAQETFIVDTLIFLHPLFLLFGTANHLAHLALALTLTRARQSECPHPLGSMIGEAVNT